MIAIGIGCRKGCPADEIIALVGEALASLGCREEASGLYTIIDKRDERGLAEAAAHLDLPLIVLDAATLARCSAAARTRSPRIAAMHGLPSVAETAALAGAGEGAVLLVERRASVRATCAIAGPPPGSRSDDPQAQRG